MRVTTLQVQGLKSHADTGTLELEPITVIVGPNNSGKSTLLQALSFFQQGFAAQANDYRIGMTPSVRVELKGLEGRFWGNQIPDGAPKGVWTYTPANIILKVSDGTSIGNAQAPAIEPDNFIYPYFSKRKVYAYSQEVNLGLATQVRPDLSLIVSKVNRVSNAEHPAYSTYKAMCTQAIGFPLITFASPQGQQVGVYVDNFRTIPLESMGEGVASIVGLIAELCIANGNLFLIEELENDVHPRALKALLELIIQSSDENQFVVSTHSNIVLRTLGSTKKSAVIYVSLDPDKALPTSMCRPLSNSPAERVAVLSDMGYEPYDFDLWDGWLILEESSAERIIRDYLIPFFVPRLSRVRLLSANGVSNVGPTFEDFNRLFRFAHLEQMYFRRAWVIVDGDASGSETVEQLRSKFTSWPESHFLQWSKQSFELYYPEEFQDRSSEVLSVKNRQQRREAKIQLLNDVRDWLDADFERAREALGRSAGDVISTLEKIEAVLGPHLAPTSVG